MQCFLATTGGVLTGTSFGLAPGAIAHRLWWNPLCRQHSASSWRLFSPDLLEIRWGGNQSLGM